MNTCTISRNDFKVSACVDWVKVTIYTEQETQFRYIKAELDRIIGANSFADPKDKQPDTGQNATVFELTFHDKLANDPVALTAAFNILSEKFPFKAVPTISGIEVACDFRHKGPQVEERRAETLSMVYRLQTSLYAPGATKPRQFDPQAGPRNPDGSAKGANRFMGDIGARIDPVMNYRIGNKSDNVSWQVYFKTTDSNKQPIEVGAWRARVEVTLQGPALQRLGLNSLADLQGFNFRALTMYFKFRRPIALDVLEASMGGSLVRIGAMRLNRPLHDATSARGIDSFKDVGWVGRRCKRLAESRHLEPDNELQDAVKGALRRLVL
jgi:hypothetical protein